VLLIPQLHPIIIECSSGATMVVVIGHPGIEVPQSVGEGGRRREEGGGGCVTSQTEGAKVA